MANLFERRFWRIPSEITDLNDNWKDNEFVKLPKHQASGISLHNEPIFAPFRRLANHWPFRNDPFVCVDRFKSNWINWNEGNFCSVIKGVIWVYCLLWFHGFQAILEFDNFSSLKKSPESRSRKPVMNAIFRYLSDLVQNQESPFVLFLICLLWIQALILT